MSELDSMSRAFDWDDEIKNDSSPFQILPEGDYSFTVKKFERAWHSGSEKIPSCKKAILTVAIANAETQGEVLTTLFLHTNVEWKLCQFFTAIGMRKHGEAVRMNWGAVPGATGSCHVGVRKWIGNDGKERESNEITEFYDPKKAPPIPANQPPAAQGPGQAWTDLPPGNPTPWSTGNF